ncbi:furin, partial [Biomphalaria pfeifferi]
DPNASYDVNGHDPDPQPRYDYSNENRHGTRCAGEVAAHADNNVCGLGVAYNARIGGVRMLDGDVTDSVEAQSLGLNFDHIHIYSASWGPDDDGRTGRKGLGSIYVWASGNGGRDSDNCNCDGYTNSIYTISISSATENGHIPWYSEACSSTLATTYSSGSGGEKQIVTTDLRKSCTETHTGTSGSAPLAAGIIALALEANPMLTWRDMQHIVVETAKADNLNAPDWAFNGVGKKVSHSFGFGLMDAAAMVSLARNWTTVPAQHICEIRCSDHNSRIIPTNGKIFVPLTTDGCEHTVNHVKYLEHVQARITLSSYRRGEIRIFLSSPSNTRSTLLAKRTRDVSKEGFNNWAFMTTHNWGEPAKGQWTLEIENGASIARPVKLRDWVLVLYGTDSPPRKSPTSARSPHYDYGVHYNVNEPPRPVDRTKTTFTYDDPMYNTDEDEDYYQKTPAPLTTRPPTTTTTKSTTPFYQAYQGNRKQSVDSPHYPTHNPELKEWTLVMMGTSPHLTKRNGSTQSGSNNATSDGSFTCAGVTSNGICIGKVRELRTVSGRARELRTVSGKVGELRTVSGKVRELRTVSGKVRELKTVSGKVGELRTVSGKVRELRTVSGRARELRTVSGKVGELRTVSGKVRELRTVSGKVRELKTVSGKVGELRTVSGKVRELRTVSGRARELRTVSGKVGELRTVSGKVRELRTVSGKVRELKTVSGKVGELRTVSGRARELRTVSGKVGELRTVSGKVRELRTVSGKVGELRTVSGKVRELRTVSGKVGELRSVSGKVGKLRTVSGKVGELRTVSGKVGELRTVSGRARELRTVSGKFGELRTVSGRREFECKPGYFKMGEHCVAHCPQHYFGSVQGSKSMLHSQGECKLCHDSCLNCKGSKATDCFQCASGFERKGDVCEKKMIWDLLDPDVMKHLAWAIILCIAAILLFSVVFGILQARERGRLCWKNKPNYVPDWGKGHYDGVTPNLAMHDHDMEAEFSLPAKTHTLFSQAIGYKHQRCSNRPGQFV